MQNAIIEAITARRPFSVVTVNTRATYNKPTTFTLHITVGGIRVNTGFDSLFLAERAALRAISNGATVTGISAK